MTTIALAIVAIVSLLLVVENPDPENASLVLMTAAIMVAAPLILSNLKLLPWLQLTTITILLMLLDNPSGNPFYNVTPATEELGRWIFVPPWRYSAVPLPFSIVEVLAIYFAGRSIWAHVRTPKSQREPLFTNANGAPFLIMAAWGVLLCLFRRQDLADAVFQTRSIPIYGLVGLAAANFIKSEDDLWNLLRVLAACAVIKSAQGLFIWYDDFEAGRIQKRYLIDHYYSDAFVHTILFLTGSAFIPSPRPFVLRVFWRIILIIPVCAALYLNNRRTAYIGGAISMIFLPFFVAPAIMKRYSKTLFKAGVFGLAIFLAILLRKFNGNSGHVYISDTSALYRVNENLNLLELVRYFPLTGAGFGVTMPLTHQLASLGTFYREFNLIPHNSLLFIWGFLGPVALALFTCYCSEGIASGLKIASTPTSRDIHHRVRSKVMGFLILSQVIRWIIYVYSDMGLVEARFGLIVPLIVAGAAIIIKKRERMPLAPESAPSPQSRTKE